MVFEGKEGEEWIFRSQNCLYFLAPSFHLVDVSRWSNEFFYWQQELYKVILGPQEEFFYQVARGRIVGAGFEVAWPVERRREESIVVFTQQPEEKGQLEFTTWNYPAGEEINLGRTSEEITDNLIQFYVGARGLTAASQK